MNETDKTPEVIEISLPPLLRHLSTLDLVGYVQDHGADLTITIPGIGNIISIKEVVNHCITNRYSSGIRAKSIR